VDNRHDQTADNTHTAIEAFIPVTRFALIDTLARDAQERGNVGELVSFFNLLGQWRHTTHHDRLMRLKERYMPFSPDRDTVRVLTYSKEELVTLQQTFIQDISVMLRQANYTLIDKDELDRLLSTHSAHGLELKVDRSEYEEIMVYYRGAGEEILEKRNWRRLFKVEKIVVPTFKRLFLLLKLKPEHERIKEVMAEKKVDEKKAKKLVDHYRKQLPKTNSDNHIYLKLFKNIPQEDLEMMFPNTRVQFKLLDKVKLGMTAGGGTLASVVGAASKAMAAVATANPVALAGAIFGVVGVITRQVMNFFNTRNRYMLALSQRLYFHSLADNRGAFTLLSDRAEEEDVKEDLLLYYFIYHTPMLRSELPTLARSIEGFLADRFKVKVNFDIEDALSRLEGDGIVMENDQGRLYAPAPTEANHLLVERMMGKMTG
jgi:hypothetical protein